MLRQERKNPLDRTSLTWVGLSLLSALFTSLRHVYVKQYCRDVPAEALVSLTRFFGTLVLLPGLFFSPVSVSSPERFLTVLAVTVVLTAIATTVQLHIIQKDPLSSSVPYLSLTPVFMIPFAAGLLREFPSAPASVGIAVSCVGAYALNVERGQRLFQPVVTIVKQSSSRHMLLIAAALGCTTVCDKIAIGASSAFTYTLVWTAASALVMAVTALARHGVAAVLRHVNRRTFLQALLWAVSFLSQMAAVKAAFGVTSGVTYVKLLTMLSVVISAGFGWRLFKEKNAVRNVAAAAVMVAGAALVVAAR